MSFVFLVIVPILTMRVLAEERRQKTDQLLYSLPLTMTRVILGKYAALLVVFLVPVALVSLYPLVLSAFGSVYLPAAYSAILGFFLLGASLIAIGVFISSVTESQAVAAGICFVVMLLNYFLSSLASYVSTSSMTAFVAGTVLIVILAALLYWMTKSAPAAVLVGVVLEAALIVAYVLSGASFEGVFPDLMEQLSLFERFYDFVDGVLDLTSVVYFLTVIGVFLFLSVQSMEKRRWSE
jgi:ABC-2 type transport system permease protein